jgi:phage tail-like protein
MATEREDGNPYSNFNFVVEVDGTEIAAFTDVSGLDTETTPIEYREGADPTNALRQLPGLEKYTTVSLKRGISGSLALWEWRKDVIDGGSAFPARVSVTVKLLNETHDRGNPAMTRTLTNAWPTKLTGPTLAAKSGEIAVEELGLVVENVEWK